MCCAALLTGCANLLKPVVSHLLHQDNAARAQILAAQTRKFQLGATVDLLAVASALPVNVTGADIGAVSTAAYGRALERKLSQLRRDARHALCADR